MRTSFFLSLLLLCCLALPAAASDASCELTAIEASTNGKGIDPELLSLKELTEPPLSTTYSRFVFQGRTTSELAKNVEKEATLNKTHKAQLTYLGEDEKGKLKLKLKLSTISFDAEVKMKSGAYFFTATRSGFLLAVKCSKKS
jgi:hypothetical protein